MCHRLEARARGYGTSWGRSIDYPHAVGAGGAKLSDCVRQCADGRNMEDWVRILTVVQASLGQNDGDEVDARVAKQGNRRAVREQLHISRQQMSLTGER